MFLLFNMSNPLLWVAIVAVIFLLFGGSKLPQLAKALGQSKKAFKDGLAEGESEEEEKSRNDLAGSKSASLSAVDDEALFEEARRRARLRVAEGDIPDARR
ncbi:MAG: Sec-independent protein translocase protein TatA [Acidobacteria bacterium]|nr:Sec-independent protein translocase protein TatA [Acidobacteriota bacterium]